MVNSWYVNDGRLLKTLEGNVLKNKFSIDRHPITFSPDGKFLAIGGEGRSNGKDLIEMRLILPFHLHLVLMENF